MEPVPGRLLNQYREMSMKNIRNCVRLAVSLFAALTIVQSFLSVAKELCPETTISVFLYIFAVALLGFAIFIANGFFLEGYLVRSASIPIRSIGMRINVKRGDIFTEDGVVVVGVNDFFDTVVDDHHISKDSLHGIMIKKYWSGNCLDLDAQIAHGLVDKHFEVVSRDGIAKERRYPIGTSVFVKTESGKRFVLVALSRTNEKTHRVQSILRDLEDAIRGALTLARENANGDKVSFPLMGTGNARIKAPEQALFNVILSVIIAECLEKDKVSNEVNIVLYKNALNRMNLFEIEAEWRI